MNCSDFIYNMYNIQDKVVVVTGGTGGIGGGLCDFIGQAGAKIAIIDINDDAIKSKVEDLSNKGIDAKGYKADITNLDSVNKTFENVYNDFGSIYGLINCAGISHVEFLSSMSIDAWQKVMDVNVRGTVLCTKVAGSYMEKGGVGRIINISSLAATHGKPKYTAYTPSKAAINAFTFTIAAEWGRKNINVNAISPVMVITGINRQQIENNPEYYRSIMNSIPKGTACSAELLAGTVIYLLSDASYYVTGQCIGCDGGSQNGDINAIKPE